LCLNKAYLLSWESKYKTRCKAVNALVPLSSYNECFYWATGIMSSAVNLEPKYSYLQVLYVYGLRKIVGLGHCEIEDIMCFGSLRPVGYSIKLACRYCCVFDLTYSLSFVEDFKRLKAICKPFRKRLTGAERAKKFRDKRRNKIARKSKKA